MTNAARLCTFVTTVGFVGPHVFGQACDGWAPLGGGLSNEGSLPSPDGPVVFNTGSGPALYLAGGFDTADGLPCERFARWDGTAWSVPDGGGLAAGLQLVYATRVYDDGSGPSIWTVGGFKKAGGKTVNGVARWDGKEWFGVGSGVEGGSPPAVITMLPWDPDAGGPAREQLVIGGWFYSVDGIAANRIAAWDGKAWAPLGDGFPGNGSRWVVGLAVFDNGTGPALYAGYAGFPDQDGVYRWNGASWTNIGPANGALGDIAVYDDGQGPALYAAGSFDEIGGVKAGGLARWGGTEWEPVGGGVEGGFVDGMDVLELGAGPELVLCGNITAVGGEPAGGIASWNGNVWRTFGGGMDDPSGDAAVYGTTVWDDGTGPALYASGSFDSAGGEPALGIARYELCPPCYPDFTGDGALDLFDFLGFVNAFNAGAASADCTSDGVFDLFDFLCFVNAFNTGC